jgi:hypothetical protein
MTKDEIIKALRDMAKYPTVTLPRDCEALRAAADLLEQTGQVSGNILMDAYKAMQAMKVEGPLHVVCQCDKCKAQSAPVQEPVACLPPTPISENALYTTPPQRTWVGLTDKELEEFSEAELGAYDLCLEVESKLKQKNT